MVGWQSPVDCARLENERPSERGPGVQIPRPPPDVELSRQTDTLSQKQSV